MVIKDRSMFRNGASRRSTPQESYLNFTLDLLGSPLFDTR